MIFVGRRGQWMQHSAHPTRFFGGGAMSLTLRAHGTGAAVGKTGGVEHAQRAIAFGASFLWVECCSLRTAKPAIGLKHKVLSSQASHTSRTRPLRRRDQRVLPVQARRQVGMRGEPRERKAPFEPGQTR
jgi:hypothetical protein